MWKYVVLACASPVLVFMILISFGEGCFLCLTGGAAGGVFEAALNIGLAAGLVGALGFMVWRDIARNRKD